MLSAMAAATTLSQSKGDNAPPMPAPNLSHGNLLRPNVNGSRVFPNLESLRLPSTTIRTAPDAPLYPGLESLRPASTTSRTTPSISGTTVHPRQAQDGSASQSVISQEGVDSDTTVLASLPNAAMLVSLAGDARGPALSGGGKVPETPMTFDFAPIYLPVPLGGFPPVHNATPDALTQNIDPTQLQDWQSRPPSTCVAVRVFGADYPSQYEAKAMVDRIRAGITALTRCKTVEVAAPLAARSISGELVDPLPVTFLAFNLPAQVASRLKKQVYWSTKSIAFFCYELLPSVPELLFTLRGFTHRVPKELEAVIKRTMSQTEYRNLTLSFAMNDPEFVGQRPEAIFNTLIRSLQIKIVDNLPSGPLAVHVYGKPPTRVPELWSMWRDALGTAEFYSSYVGVGHRQPNWSCSGCRGADHLRAQCPFEKLPGWNRANLPRGPA